MIECECHVTGQRNRNILHPLKNKMLLHVFDVLVFGHKDLINICLHFAFCKFGMMN